MDPDPVRTLAAAGLFDQAITAARAAVSADPRSPAAYEKLGSVLALTKRYEDAAKALAVAIALNPASAEALNNFGAVLRAVGKPDEAQTYFERALEVSPGFHEALMNALPWYQKYERDEAALRLLHGAIDGGDRSAETYEALGAVLFRLGRLERAIEALETAVRCDPGLANAWATLANARTEFGDLAGGQAAIEEAIRLNPRRPEYYRYLTSTTRSTACAAFTETLEALVADPCCPTEQRVEAHFALGDVAASRSDWETAFHHYVKGNAINRSLLEYDELEMVRNFNDIETIFSKDVLARGSLGYHGTQRPVFIFGMPRSGTTLIEQIIASHPYVCAGGELTFLDDIVRGVFARPGHVTAEVGVRYADAIDRIAPPMAMRVTDKMPLNFRYAGLIRMVLPNARLIHARRDALDTCWSCFSTLFSDGIAWTCDLHELGHYYRAYSKLMRHWKDVFPDGAMLEVQYEDLVGDLETHARRIIAHCGLEWDDRCLSFYETKRMVRTASASQVRQPIYSHSVGRSRAYGELLRPLRDALGIEL